MAISLATTAATRGIWAGLPADLTDQLVEWGLDRAEYLVGLCEPGEAAAERVLRDMGLDEFTDDPAVVKAFAQLRALAVPSAEAAARRSAAFRPMIEAARCAAEKAAKRCRTSEAELVVASSSAAAGRLAAGGVSTKWPTRLRRKLAEAGNPRAARMRKTTNEAAGSDSYVTWCGLRASRLRSCLIAQGQAALR